MAEKKTVRVFIASSHDELEYERLKSLSVINQLDDLFAHLDLKAVLAEYNTVSGSYPSFERIQDKINTQLDASDIVVVIFYTRLGTYTKEELFRALEWDKKVFLYFRNGFEPVSEEQRAKYEEVKNYKAKLREESRIRYETYDTPSDFSDLLYRELNQYLNAQYPASSNSSNTSAPSSFAQLKIDVADGKTGEVLDKLLKLDPSSSNTYILLMSRWNALQRKINSGLIAAGDANIETNRINHSVMSVIDDLEE